MLTRRKSRSSPTGLPRSLLLAALIAVGGCATRPLYAPPVGLTQTAGATLLGSKHGDSLLFAERTYVAGVDGRRSGLSAADYDKPVLLAAGSHSIDIGF